MLCWTISEWQPPDFKQEIGLVWISGLHYLKPHNLFCLTKDDSKVKQHMEEHKCHLDWTLVSLETNTIFWKSRLSFFCFTRRSSQLSAKCLCGFLLAVCFFSFPKASSFLATWGGMKKSCNNSIDIPRVASSTGKSLLPKG